MEFIKHDGSCQCLKTSTPIYDIKINQPKEGQSVFKTAIAQIEITPGAPAVNAEKIIAETLKAKNDSAEIIIFPAMALCGKLIGDRIKDPAFLADCREYIEKIAASAVGINIIFGAPDDNGTQSVFFIDTESKITFFPHEDKAFTLSLSDKEITFFLAHDRFSLSSVNARRAKLTNTAKKLGKKILYVNSTGIENTGKTVYIYDGNSAVCDEKGNIIHALPSYEEKTVYIDLDALDALTPFAQENASESAAIYSSLSYGVKKFLHTINVKNVVIGISGGIDSAVAAALYASVLPRENIWLINLPGRFNSATTKNSAKSLAENLGCRYAVFPIEKSVDETINQLESTPFLLDGKESFLTVSSFTKENIQARDRSSRVLAAVAACVGGVFTCNANKAEATVGYATLYGDQAGFLSALADLWKFQVYELADYLNETIYHREVIPASTINLPPSAELSPEQNPEEGHGDPLVYPYHDYLFRAFTQREPMVNPVDLLEWYLDDTLEQKIGCESGIVKKLFPDTQSFTADLERWWSLYSGMSVAKRIQAPPLIAISDFPFGDIIKESQNGVYYPQKYLRLKKNNV